MVVRWVVGLSLLPAVLAVFGVDLGVPEGVEGARMDHQAMAGAFVHTILEGAAIFVAGMAAVLGYLLYRLKRDPVVSVIAVVFAVAAATDMMHILAEDRLFRPQNEAEFFPYTWAISRIINAAVLCLGGLVLMYRPARSMWTRHEVAAALVVLAIVAAVLAVVHTDPPSAPRASFPDALVRRPWDAVPLLFLIPTAVWIFPRVQRRFPSSFATALAISLIAHIATQCYMTFGSARLYDHAFNAGHFLKVVAYLVPLAGIVLDLVHSYEREVETARNLRQVEAALRDSEERLSLTLAVGNIGVWAWDAVANRIHTDPVVDDIFGVQLRCIEDFEPCLLPEDREPTMAAVQQAVEQGVPYDVEYRVQHPDATLRYVAARGAMQSGPQGAPERFTGVCIDITAVKEAAAAIERSEELLRETGAMAKVGGWSFEAESNEWYWSDEVCRIHDVPSGHRPTLEEGIEYYPGKAKKAIRAAVDEALTDGTGWDLELPFVTAKGSYRWVRAKGEPDRRNGSVSRITGMFQDITDRKVAQLELERTMDELARSNEELERFAYVASHDLQEPLRTVASFTELLTARYGDRLEGEAAEFMAFVVDGARRMQRLIDDLLAFSRVGTGGIAIGPCDTDAVVRQVVAGLAASIQEAEATVEFGALPVVEADSSLIERIFQNLIANAVKFRADHPLTVTISAKRRATAWEFRVRDNGIGIDPQFADRVFVIFQRLHLRDSYPGTGIGLAISKKIVDLHGGHLVVESQEGAGSTFVFTLPQGVRDGQ